MVAAQADRRLGLPGMGAAKCGGAGWTGLVREAQPGAPLARRSVGGRAHRGRRRERLLLPAVRRRLWSRPGAAGRRAASRSPDGHRGGRVAAGQRGVRLGPLAGRLENATQWRDRRQAGAPGEPLRDDTDEPNPPTPRSALVPLPSEGRGASFSPYPRREGGGGVRFRLRRSAQHREVGLVLDGRGAWRCSAGGADVADAWPRSGTGLGAGAGPFRLG